MSEKIELPNGETMTPRKRECDYDKYEHPSYGKVSISRVNSTGTNLFGSSVKHHTFFHLEIKTASKHKDEYHESVLSEDMIIRVALSGKQFIDMLTLTNTDGVPCTLEYYFGKEGFVKAPPCPEIHRKQEMIAGVKERIRKNGEKVTSLRQRLKELRKIPKSKLSADDLATLFSLCDQLSQEVESNLPYFAETLNKHVDNLITEAGHEVETVVNDKLLSMGLEALKASLPQLTFDNQGEE
jgi:hypothetical protein